MGDYAERYTPNSRYFDPNSRYFDPNSRVFAVFGFWFPKTGNMNIGDNVRINNKCFQKKWVGKEGIVIYFYENDSELEVRFPNGSIAVFDSYKVDLIKPASACEFDDSVIVWLS